MVANIKAAGTVISKVNPIVNRTARILEQRKAKLYQKADLKFL